MYRTSPSTSTRSLTLAWRNSKSGCSTSPRRLSFETVMKLSSASTRMPRASRASHKCEPMKPAPPETTARSFVLVAADTPVREPELAHCGRVVDVAPVHDHRHPHRRLDTVEVEVAKLVPLRDDDQRIAAVGDAVRIAHVLDLRQLDARAFHGRGIVGADVCARGE